MEIQRSGGKCQGHRGTQSVFFLWLTSFHHLHDAWWGLSMGYRVPGQTNAPWSKGQLLNWLLHFEPQRSGGALLIAVTKCPQGTGSYSRPHGQRDKASNLCLSGDIRAKFLHLAIRIYGAPSSYQAHDTLINTHGLKVHCVLLARRHKKHLAEHLSCPARIPALRGWL